MFEHAVDVHCCPTMQCTDKIGELLSATNGGQMAPETYHNQK